MSLKWHLSLGGGHSWGYTRPDFCGVNEADFVVLLRPIEIKVKDAKMQNLLQLKTKVNNGPPIANFRAALSYLAVPRTAGFLVRF